MREKEGERNGREKDDEKVKGVEESGNSTGVSSQQ